MSEEPASSSSSKMEVCVVCRDRRVQIQIGGREVGLGWTFPDTCDFYINGLWIQCALLHVTIKMLRTCVCTCSCMWENTPRK